MCNRMVVFEPNDDVMINDRKSISNTFAVYFT